MGMFDWIDYVMKCPKCGKLIQKFQSKDRDCEMDILLPYDVVDFYASCDNCDTWISFHRKKPRRYKNFVEENFDMTVREK